MAGFWPRSCDSNRPAAAAAATPMNYAWGVRQRRKRLVAWSLISLGKRSGKLTRFMGWYSVRRMIGPASCRTAWCALGATIDDTARIGARVWVRNPKHVTIGAGSRLGGRVWIDSWGEISIGRNVLMNGEIDLLSTQHLLDHPRFKGKRRSVSIGDYVWLPWKIVVLPGVGIGNYAVIGTGSVVASDVPDYGVAAGNPARVVKERARIEYTYVPSGMPQAPHG
jgi:acetyltransferase-like isoleucine patch superfamily enzyme